MKIEVGKANARQAFDDILARFPNLEFVESEGSENELDIKIIVQTGIQYEVWLSFQNDDELHLGIGEFWGEWFPCTDIKVVNDYITAVAGCLDGGFRVIEHYRGTRCLKAELQAPDNNDWSTVYTWSRLWLPFPWTSKVSKEVRNLNSF